MTARGSHRAQHAPPRGAVTETGAETVAETGAVVVEEPAPLPGQGPGPDLVAGFGAEEEAEEGAEPGAGLVREGPPPGVGRLLWHQTRVLGQPLAVLAHPGRGTVTTVVELTPASGELLAGVQRYGPLTAPADGGAPPAPVLRQLLGRLSGAGSPFVRLQVLASSYPPDRTGRVHLVAALPMSPAVVSAARAAGERRTRDRNGTGLALLAGRATLDLARHLAECGLSLSGFLDTAALTELIRSRYDPGPGGGRHCAASPWPTEVDATHHRSLRTTTGGTSPSDCYHATAWVKSWPTTADGLDLTAPLRLPRLSLPRTAALVLDLGSGQASTAAGYLSVSARTPAELDQLRVDLRRMLPADSPLQLEWTDREHHLAFAHTLPLATGLAKAPSADPTAHF